MPSNLLAERYTNTTTSLEDAYTAPNGTADKTTLLTGLRVVNSSTTNTDRVYSIEIQDASSNNYVLQKDDTIQARSARDLAPGGTTMVLNKGDKIRLKADAIGGVTLHIDVIERS